ncbi:hypothetical protein ACSSS7_000997 [Eimeria intestinalis]
MSDSRSSPARPVAGEIFTYTPLPLVYPPIDPPPGCSVGLSQQYPAQQQQGQFAALAAAAAAANATRQQLLHRMRQACLLHQRMCDAHQTSVARTPLGAPQSAPLFRETDLSAAAAAGARDFPCGGFPLYPSFRGSSSFPDAFHGGLSPVMGPAPSGAPLASGAARVSMGGGPPPTEGGSPDVQFWMERQRQALGVAEVYDGQLRLWRAFAAQLQLYLLLATQEAAAARLTAIVASNSSNDNNPDYGHSPSAPSGLFGATLTGPSPSAPSSSSEERTSINRPEDAPGAVAPTAASAAARPPNPSAAAQTDTAAGAAAVSPGQAQQQQQQQQQQRQQQQQQQQQAPWRLRFIMMYLKLLVLLFLFDAGKWVYVACLFVALLHTNGAFNPILNLITSTSHRQPFEATLAQLRRRRERRPLQQLRLQQQRLHASVGRPLEGATATPAAANRGVTSPTEEDRSSTRAADDGSSSSSNSRRDAWASSMSRDPHELRERRLPGLERQGSQPAASGAEESGRSSGAGGFEMEGVSSASGRPSAAPAAAAGAAADGGAAAGQRRRQRAASPYWKRALYQGVAMFFLTTIPWWNPDPELLIDFEGLDEETDLSGAEAHDDSSPP